MRPFIFLSFCFSLSFFHYVNSFIKVQNSIQQTPAKASELLCLGSPAQTLSLDPHTPSLRVQDMLQLFRSCGPKPAKAKSTGKQRGRRKACFKGSSLLLQGQVVHQNGSKWPKSNRRDRFVPYLFEIK